MDKVGQDWQDGESVIILYIQMVLEGPAGEVTWGKRPHIYTKQCVPGCWTVSSESHCAAFTSLICLSLLLPAARQELFERGNDIYSSLGLQFGIWSKCCLYISASPSRRSFETLTLIPAPCLEQDSSCWLSCRWNAWSEAGHRPWGQKQVLGGRQEWAPVSVPLLIWWPCCFPQKNNYKHLYCASCCSKHFKYTNAFNPHKSPMWQVL